MLSPEGRCRFCKGLGHLSYSRYENLLREIKFNMAPDFNVTNIEIVTDSDITIMDEIFLPLVEHYYHVMFNVTENRLLHSKIRNNTLRNIHLNIDSSKGSIEIENNVFIGSGIAIIKEDIGDKSTTNTTIIVQDNMFQGQYRRSVLEMRNTENISLIGNYFENLQFTYPNAMAEELNSGILCDKSQFNIHDSIFKHVKLDNVLHLNNCSVEMDNINVLENTSPIINTSSTIINIEHSRVKFSNMMFQNNIRSICIHLSKGELLVQNISMSGNQINSSESMIRVEASQIVVIGVTAVNNTGQL